LTGKLRIAKAELSVEQKGAALLLRAPAPDTRQPDLERVGEYPVRGFNDPIELFAYDG
jgi:adenylate cyclase